MTKITDTINADWLVKTDNMSADFQNGLINITEFSNDQLTYLIYFNWGYSGPNVDECTIMAENELINRGLAFDNELADKIERECEWYYSSVY